MASLLKGAQTGSLLCYCFFGAKQLTPSASQCFSVAQCLHISQEVEPSSPVSPKYSGQRVTLSLGSTALSALPFPTGSNKENTLASHDSLRESSLKSSSHTTSKGFQNQLLQILQRWYRTQLEIQRFVTTTFVPLPKLCRKAPFYISFFFFFSGALWSNWSSNSQDCLQPKEWWN